MWSSQAAVEGSMMRGQKAQLCSQTALGPGLPHADRMALDKPLPTCPCPLVEIGPVTPTPWGHQETETVPMTLVVPSM